MAEPRAVQLRRAAGWTLPAGAVSVARPTRWGNPFKVGVALARVPAVVGDGPWEYEGRCTAPGVKKDYHHPDGRVTACTTRLMTAGECVETYERALAEDYSPAMAAAAPSRRLLPFTVADVRRELAGLHLACWCPLGAPCHRDVLLRAANLDLPAGSAR